MSRCFLCNRKKCFRNTQCHGECQMTLDPSYAIPQIEIEDSMAFAIDKLLYRPGVPEGILPREYFDITRKISFS